MLEDFRFIQQFRVPFRDFDFLKHVNNAAYITWTETARCDYMVEVLHEEIDGARGWIMAKQTFTYEYAIGYREEVAVGCRISRIGTKSLDAWYEIYSKTAGRRAAYGISTLVAFDYGRSATIAVPDDWRRRINAYEKVPPE